MNVISSCTTFLHSWGQKLRCVKFIICKVFCALRKGFCGFSVRPCSTAAKNINKYRNMSVDEAVKHPTESYIMLYKNGRE